MSIGSFRFEVKAANSEVKADPLRLGGRMDDLLARLPGRLSCPPNPGLFEVYQRT